MPAWLKLLNAGGLAGGGAVVDERIVLGSEEVFVKSGGADATLRATIPHSSGGVRTMIELGVDVNGADWSGFTPLHWTSDKTTVDLLIEAGANIEGREIGGSTPLNCTHELDEICALVDHGADFNTQDKDSRMPSHMPYMIHAVNMGIVEIVEFLLKSGADETVVDNEGKTAMQRLDGGILHPNLHSYTKETQEDVDLARRARELLTNALADGADKRWRRRALLVLCIARHRRGKAQLLDFWGRERQRQLGSCGGAGAGRGVGSGDLEDISDDRGIPVKPIQTPPSVPRDQTQMGT
ncbi:EsV-1-157 [Ectocarpus siliculosus]|uniref:EsV-1-157 n=1 Tax=Ectocarpus siliculosus TaxID=2880 RepID=D7FZV2_ECTSI|nr:EsV-1-157 [Ectocarpus siliculosus]|eukprot:CBJ48577.1 EsV-1-157 [Ectocarpus siliculosus]